MLKIMEKQLEQCNFYSMIECPKCTHYNYCQLNLPISPELDSIKEEIEYNLSEIRKRREKIVYIEKSHGDEILIDMIKREINYLNNLISRLRKYELKIIKQLRIKRNKMLK